MVLNPIKNIPEITNKEMEFLKSYFTHSQIKEKRKKKKKR